jgi:hypothetical protein
MYLFPSNIVTATGGTLTYGRIVVLAGVGAALTEHCRAGRQLDAAAAFFCATAQATTCSSRPLCVIEAPATVGQSSSSASTAPLRSAAHSAMLIGDCAAPLHSANTLQRSKGRTAARWSGY